jgi:molybdopterin converting factor small subunit
MLLNGKDVSFLEGAQTPVRAGDEIHMFPPGR